MTTIQPTSTPMPGTYLIGPTVYEVGQVFEPDAEELEILRQAHAAYHDVRETRTHLYDALHRVTQVFDPSLHSDYHHHLQIFWNLRDLTTRFIYAVACRLGSYLPLRIDHDVDGDTPKVYVRAATQQDALAFTVDAITQASGFTRVVGSARALALALNDSFRDPKQVHFSYRECLVTHVGTFIAGTPSFLKPDHFDADALTNVLNLAVKDGNMLSPQHPMTLTAMIVEAGQTMVLNLNSPDINEVPGESPREKQLNAIRNEITERTKAVLILRYRSLPDPRTIEQTSKQPNGVMATVLSFSRRSVVSYGYQHTSTDRLPITLAHRYDHAGPDFEKEELLALLPPEPEIEVQEELVMPVEDVARAGGGDEPPVSNL